MDTCHVYSLPVAISNLAAKFLAVNIDQKNNQKQAIDIIKQELEIDNTEFALRFLHLIRKANVRIIKIIESLDIHTGKEEYLQSFRRFGNLFDPLKLADQWVYLRAEFLTDLDLAHIKGGCNLIVAHQSKFEMKHQNIDEFLEEIKNLIEDIDDSNLDEYVRAYLVDELNFLILAIEKFEFLGPDGAEAAFGALFAAALRVDGLAKTAWSKRLFGVLLATAAIIGGIGDIDGGVEVIRERTSQVIAYIANAQPPGLRFIEDRSNQQQ